MPRRTEKGPRLYFRPPRHDAAGRLSHAGVWLILDGRRQQSTGCARDDLGGAERALARYIAGKHVEGARRGDRDPAAIPLADVLAMYARDIAPNHARPRETAARIARLAAFFGDKMLGDVTGALCRAYAHERGSRAMARKELEDLRAAINHHRKEGHTDRVVSVVLPEKSVPRDVWLTRGEAARLLWAAWRGRETQRGAPTRRRPLRHVARFILVALYTGTRSSAVCGAALDRVSGAGFVDVERGVFYRRPQGERESRKRRPPVRLPARLVAHLRRWRALGASRVVEWNGGTTRSIKKAFRRAARDAGLPPEVTPHALRHTAATWLMQRGVSMWLAAEYLGMTVETLQRYAHHHPDYQREAAAAITRRAR